MNLTRKTSKYNVIDDNLEMESLINDGSTDEYFSSNSRPVKSEKSNSFSMASQPKDQALYSDSYLTVYNHHIVINNYFFPLMKPKTINIVDIVGITTPEASNIPWWDHMSWGRGYNNIWWAKDDTRGSESPNKSIIFSEKGEKSLKACSVQNRSLAMEIIKDRMVFS